MIRIFHLIDRRLNTAAGIMLAVAALQSCSDEQLIDSAGGPTDRITVTPTISSDIDNGTANSRGGEAGCDSTIYAVKSLDGGTRDLYLHITGGPMTNRNDTTAIPNSRATERTEIDDFSFFVFVQYGSKSDKAGQINEYIFNERLTRSGNFTSAHPWAGPLGEFSWHYLFGLSPADTDNSHYTTFEGYPCYDYTVPEDYTEQTDLLFCAHGIQYTGNTGPGSANMIFYHVLPTISVTARGNLSGTISKVTVKGLYGGCKVLITPDEARNLWYQKIITDETSSTETEYTRDINVKIEAGEECEVIVDEPFFVAKQTCPDGATFEVEFTDDLTGTKRTLSADLSGFNFEANRQYNFAISTESFIVEPTLTLLTSPEPFIFAGGTQSYRVRSTVTVTDKSGTSKESNQPWTASFKYGGSLDFISTPPSWLDITTDGNGGYDVCSATVEPAEIKSEQNTHSAALAAATELGSASAPYDLSTRRGKQTTANCYIVSAPGHYKIPAVYGNAITYDAVNTSAFTYEGRAIVDKENYTLRRFTNHLGNEITSPYIADNDGCNPYDACIVWQDANNLVTNPTVKGTSSQTYIYFDVDRSTIRQGNAIIAVRDNSGTILWSWHIWVTDESYFYIPYQFSPDTFFMSVNLGWCDDQVTYEGRSCMVKLTQPETGATSEFTIEQTEATIQGKAPYYQFGRKDPILPSDAASGKDIAVYSSEEYAPNVETSNTAGTELIAKMIQNPNIFYGHNHQHPLNKNEFGNLWDNNECPYYQTYIDDEQNHRTGKTIYDPCPEGWCVPSAFNCHEVFAETSPLSSQISYDPIRIGYNLLGLFMPLLPYRYEDNGKAGYAWDADTHRIYSSHYHTSTPTLSQGRLHFYVLPITNQRIGNAANSHWLGNLMSGNMIRPARDF